MKNKKICFLSTNNYNIRKKIIDFFVSYEFIDPKGLKQKFTIIDSLHQPTIINTIDKVENTIFSSNHFFIFKNLIL